MAPPTTHRVLSPNGKFAVVSDPRAGTRFVESSTGKSLCELPGWFRSIHVADDGEHFAIGFGGLNLIPVNADGSLDMISFWNRCRKVASVPLRTIVPEWSILQRTVSHYAWGHIDGIDKTGRLVVTRIDGHVFRFNMATGKWNDT